MLGLRHLGIQVRCADMHNTEESPDSLVPTEGIEC